MSEYASSKLSAFHGSHEEGFIFSKTLPGIDVISCFTSSLLIPIQELLWQTDKTAITAANLLNIPFFDDAIIAHFD